MSKNKNEKKCCKTSIGGQALIEGIMMQNPNGKAAVSVRTPDGKIDTQEIKVKHAKDKFKPFGWPLIRGVVNYVESMMFGYKCLMISADKSGLEDIEDSEENMSKLDKWLNAHINKKVMNFITGFASIIGVALAFLLFMYLPTRLADFINDLAGGVLTNYRELFSGIIRMVIFVGYIAAVSLMKDIKRTFMYHGAEHKTIFCYEKGLELNVENVKKQSRFHPRCGTSFIFVIIIISVIISSVIAISFPALRDAENKLIWMAVKIMILPVVTGLSYEFIRYAGKHDNFIVRLLASPGLWMQRLTTKEPDDRMIEVALSAFIEVLDDEEKSKYKHKECEAEHDEHIIQKNIGDTEEQCD